jgi:hypothetical protein
VILASLEERRRVAADALLAHPDWSDRRLAKIVGSSRDLIAYQRNRLVAGGEIALAPVVGADGKTYRTFHAGPRKSGMHSLNTRVARIREITRTLRDRAWMDAHPGARRALWLAAEQLAHEAGMWIDRATGEHCPAGRPPR